MEQQYASDAHRATAGPPPGAVVWIGVILALGGGCGEQDSSSAGAARFDACALLTGADVAAVLATDTPAPQAAERGEGASWLSTCTYEIDTPGGLRAASLLVRPHQGTSGPEKAYADYDAALALELGADASLTPVDGLGDSAGWQDFGTSIGQLAVFKGPYQLILTASGTETANQLANAQQLAERVLQRLSSR